MDQLEKLLYNLKKDVDQLKRVLVIKILRLPTNGAFSPPIVTADPVSPQEGDIWYRSDLQTWKGRKNSTTVTFTTS